MRRWLMALLFVCIIPPASGQERGDNAVTTAPMEGAVERLEATPLPSGSDRLPSTADDRRSLTVTIAPDGTAAFVDRRDLALLAGRNQLEIRDLPASLLPETLYWSIDTLPELRQLRSLPQTADDAAPRWQGALLVETGGSRIMTLSYRAEGLSATTDYRLLLETPQAARASLQRATTVHNATGMPLRNARLVMAGAEGGQTELARIRNLPADARLRIRDAAARTVAVSHALISRAQGDQPRRHPAPAPVQHHWTLDGAAVASFGAPVEVLITGDDDMQIAGRGIIQPAGEAKRATVVAGSSAAVSVQRLQAHYEHIEQGTIEIAWRLQIENHSDTAHTLMLEERIGGSWALLEGDDDWQRTPTGLARRLELAPGEAREVGYRVRTRR